MIATMHDELVFEVHEDIIEQAINEIVPIMTSNVFLTSKRWPVPLTCDTEIGQDWTVHWDLNEMRNREVRFEGDKKAKEPRKPALKDFDSPSEFRDAQAAHEDAAAAWKALPHSYPVTLRNVFKSLSSIHEEGAEPEAKPEAAPVVALVKALTVQEPDPGAEPEKAVEPDPEQVAGRATLTLVEVDDEDVPVAPVPSRAPPPQFSTSDGFFDFVLNAPLTVPTIMRLAGIIAECQNRGTRKLRISLPDGTLLEGWTEDGKECLINDQQFYWAAKREKL
jgi:hypothetical protein